MPTKYSLYIPKAMKREIEIFDLAKGYVLFGFRPILSKKIV